MIAALPMYARPELAAAHDRLWALIRDALRDRGVAAPDHLAHPEDLPAVWLSPDLVLAQTCGLPFRAVLHHKVQLVATPDYGVDGCQPGHYRSVIVARDDAPGLRLAYNDALSQSGWAAPHAHFAARGLRLVPHLCTGSHAASARAVAEGRADLAAIDAVTWALLQRYEPFAARLRVVDLTAPTPGLPLITRRDQDPAPIRGALDEALAALPRNLRDALMLRDIVQVESDDYLALPLPPAAWA